MQDDSSSQQCCHESDIEQTTRSQQSLSKCSVSKHTYTYI